MLGSQGESMRNRIFGAIGALWGGAILLYGLWGQLSQGSEAYQAGQTTGLVFGGLMFLVGIYYFFKKPKEKGVESESDQN